MACGDDANNGRSDAALDAGSTSDGGVDPDGGSGGSDGTVPNPDGGADATVPDPDGGACVPPPGLTRGAQWVRSNPVAISGLIPGMGAPSAANVSDYFDVFGATATHFWADGLPTNEAAWSAVGHSAYRFITWTQANGNSPGTGQVVGGVPGLPGRIGYQIGDEPGDLTDWSTMQVGVTAVRAADPAALIIVNFSTTNPSAGDLATMLAEASANPDVDVLAYDLYTYTQGAYEPLEMIRAAAQAHGKVYWRYLNSYHAPGESDPPTYNDMRWDAFVGVLYGYTGHSWFLYQVGPPHSGSLESDLFVSTGSYDAQTTQHFQWAAALNAQLAVLGRTVSLLASTDVRYVASSSLTQPDGTTGWSAGAGGDPYLTGLGASNNLHEFAVGFFTDDCGDVYVMVQNANHTHGNFPTVLNAVETITLSFDFASASEPAFDPTTVDVLDKDTGVVSAVSLTSTGATTAELTITLDPGDVYFYKYRTGNPFVQQ